MATSTNQAVMESEYKKYIQNLASNNDSAVFYNSGPEHAAIVMSTIFKNSKETLKMYVGDFCGDVSKDSDYLIELQGFLERDGILSIVVGKYVPEKNPDLFKILSSYKYFKPGNISFKQTNATVTDSVSHKPIHFTVGDSKMFRLEEDIEKYIAKGSFNNPTTSKMLSGVFDKLHENGTEIDLTH